MTDLSLRERSVDRPLHSRVLPTSVRGVLLLLVLAVLLPLLVVQAG